MASDPRNDLVAQQYRKWQYPEPIEDVAAWLQANFDWFDPRLSHRLFWPDRDYQPEMEILIAGCGTNQAPVVAYNNPAARVTAIDISQESLDHGRYLKHKHGLTNLDLRLLPIEEVATLQRSFDLIIASGVLHHMASPETGMKALAGVLRPDGVAAIMLYARYGRIGVEMMQGVFRELGLRQDEESLRLVRAGLDRLSKDHPVQSYVADAPDLGYDAGMVDTFLHGRDVSFTVQGCLDLVEGAGLVFQDWCQRKAYYPPFLVEPDNPFVAAVHALPERRMWSIMEVLNSQTACHLFLACRPERPPRSYRIDFTSAAAPDFVPVWYPHARLAGDTVVRHDDWTVTLGRTYLAMVERVDGRRSIREIAADVAASGQADGTEVTDIEALTASLFEGLWRLDFIAVDLSAQLRG